MSLQKDITYWAISQCSVLYLCLLTESVGYTCKIDMFISFLEIIRGSWRLIHLYFVLQIVYERTETKGNGCFLLFWQLKRSNEWQLALWGRETPLTKDVLDEKVWLGILLRKFMCFSGYYNSWSLGLSQREDSLIPSHPALSDCTFTFHF